MILAGAGALPELSTLARSWPPDGEVAGDLRLALSIFELTRGADRQQPSRTMAMHLPMLLARHHAPYSEVPSAFMVIETSAASAALGVLLGGSLGNDFRTVERSLAVGSKPGWHEIACRRP